MKLSDFPLEFLNISIAINKILTIKLKNKTDKMQKKELVQKIWVFGRAVYQREVYEYFLEDFLKRFGRVPKLFGFFLVRIQDHEFAEILRS